MAANQKFWSPSSAAGTSITPANTAFTNSAWATVFTASADSILTDLLLTEIPVADVAVMFDIGVSSNGGTTWTVIDTRLCYIRDFSTNVTNGRIPLPIPLDAIPSGDLVGVRMRKTGTSTTTWNVKLGYLKKPLSDAVDTTTYAGIALPDGAALFSLAGNATAWAYGAETILIPSAPYPLAIEAYCVPRDSNGEDFEIEVLRNGAHFDTFRGHNTLVGDLHYNPIWNPLGGMEAGDVLSARQRGATNSAINLGLTYVRIG